MTGKTASIGETTENLQDYLLWQMRLTPFSDVDAAIALAIIDAIDESGYLTATLEGYSGCSQQRGGRSRTG